MRLQSNTVVLQRRSEAPKSWLGKQRVAVGGSSSLVGLTLLHPWSHINANFRPGPTVAPSRPGSIHVPNFADRCTRHIQRPAGMKVWTGAEIKCFTLSLYPVGICM